MSENEVMLEAKQIVVEEMMRLKKRLPLGSWIRLKKEFFPRIGLWKWKWMTKEEK
ncbi:MAG: hypothetical protein KDH96_03295 [Candidatus Riesia sp.]|nr:hypothetical protein [Candidatus Riesia sp.]